MRLLFVLCFLLNIFKSGSAAAFAHESLNAWWLQISEAAKCRTDSCPPHGCIELLPVDKNSPKIPGLGASLAKIRGLSAFHVGFSECGVLVACDDPNFRNNPIRMLWRRCVTCNVSFCIDDVVAFLPLSLSSLRNVHHLNCDGRLESVEEAIIGRPISDLAAYKPIDVQIEAASVCQAAYCLLLFFAQSLNYQCDIKSFANDLLLCLDLQQSAACDRPCSNCLAFRQKFAPLAEFVECVTMRTIFKIIPPQRIRATLWLLALRDAPTLLWMLDMEYESFGVQDVQALRTSNLFKQICCFLPVKDFDLYFEPYQRFMLWLFKITQSREFDDDRNIFHSFINDNLYDSRFAAKARFKYNDCERRMDNFIVNQLINGVLEGCFNDIYASYLKISTIRHNR